ncbi:MAG: hemerythrin-like metal-binding protein [Firmicutes bacterium]|nr:hemerythrin-like metal-binding protein [Bacillota bacterium]
MAFWEWQETYSININKFDVHHQKLFTLINNLYASVFQCKDTCQKQVLIRKTLAELVDYTYYHFAQEEEFLLTYEYPDYMPHKEEHEQFKKHLTQLMEQYEDDTFVWSLPVLIFLKDWISLHVLNTDKQYGSYLNEKNVK